MKNKPQARRGLLALGSGAVAGLVAALRPLNAASRVPDSQPPLSFMRVAAQDGELPKHEVRPGSSSPGTTNGFGAPWGDAEPIVLLHGVAESHVAWQQWVPFLSGRFRVIRPDLPGFGQSPLPASYSCTTREVASDMIRLLDALKNRPVSPGRREDWRFDRAATGRRSSGTGQDTGGVRYTRERSPGRQGGSDVVSSHDTQGRCPRVGRRDHAVRLGSDASPEMMRWWTDELMGKASPDACIGYSGAVAGMDLEPLLGKITAPTLVVTTEASPLQPVSAGARISGEDQELKAGRASGEFLPHRRRAPSECARGRCSSSRVPDDGIGPSADGQPIVVFHESRIMLQVWTS